MVVCSAGTANSSANSRNARSGIGFEQHILGWFVFSKGVIADQNRKEPFQRPALQVTRWRELLGLQPQAGLATLDSWGLKKLFSLAMRRWVAGAKGPRVTWLQSLGFAGSFVPF